MKKYRVLALALVLILSLSLFAACSGTEPEPSGTTTEATTEATTAATTAKKLDLGGRTVILAAHKASDYLPEVGASQFHDDWQAVYDALCKEFNFTLEITTTVNKYPDALEHIVSGDIDYLGDLCNMKTEYWIPCALNGYLAKLNSDEVLALGLDVSDSKAFYQPYTQAMKLGDDIYAAQWNGKFRTCEFGWCMYANLDYLSEYAGESDIFAVVRDMGWTWEKFLDVQQKCTKDTDGDGTIDIWGCAEHSYGQEIFTIDGGCTVYKDADGKYVSGLALPESIEALLFAQDYYNNGYNETSLDYGDTHRLFCDGGMALLWGEKKNTDAGRNLDGCGIRYGILPIPKQANAEKYVNVLGGVRSFALFKGNSHYAENAALLYQFGLAFTDDDWKDSFLEQNCAGNRDSLEMVCDYIIGDHARTVIDYAWGSEVMEDWFRENIYFPLVTKTGTVRENVEGRTAEFQAQIDAAFQQ